MAVSARATLIFDADDGKLAETAKHIDARLGELSEKFKGLKETAIGVFVLDKLPEIYARVADGIKQVLEVGDHFHNLAANTGVAVDELVVLEEEFRAAGKSADELPEILAHMGKVLTQGTENQLITNLGVDLESLKKKTPIEQFHELGKAIGELKNPNDRATAAMALMGKAGHDLVAMFREEGFGSAAERVGEQAQILSQDAALFADASTKLGAAGLKTRGFFVGVADQIVPVIMPLLDRFEKFDAAQAGKSAGSFVNSLVGGNPAQTIVAALMTSAAQVVEFLVDGLLSAAGNFGLLMQSVAEVFTAQMLHGLASFLDKASHVPGLGWAAGGASGAAEGAAQSLDKSAQAYSKQFGWIHSGIMDEPIRLFQESLSGDIDDALNEAAGAHDLQLGKHPQIAEAQGDPELMFAQPNVSHLGSIGGAFGSFSGVDPLIEANAIARDHTALLQQIATNTANAPRKAASVPEKHPE